MIENRVLVWDDVGDEMALPIGSFVTAQSPLFLRQARQNYVLDL